jgi:hypothetical protein
MPSLEYYTSERFIQDALVHRVSGAIPKLFEYWRVHHRIDPFLLTWPANTVLDVRGAPVNDTCKLDLKDIPQERHQTTILEAIRLTDAYALFFVEQKATEVVAILESKHGTHSWHFAVQRSGDVSILGQPTEKTDVDSVGLLWAPKRGAA